LAGQEELTSRQAVPVGGGAEPGVEGFEEAAQIAAEVADLVFDASAEVLALESLV
jgi:hypothetical protein